MSTGLSMDDPVCRAFIGYAAAVLAKTLLMSLMTANIRMSKKVFASEEDATYFKRKVVMNDPSVERVRRAHLNDLENVIPFVLLGLLYVITGPTLSTALLHFRVFTAARILHTIVYLTQVPQPARAITFMAGMVVNGSFVYQIIRQASFL